jgi:hypothetical protein
VAARGSVLDLISSTLAIEDLKECHWIFSRPFAFFSGNSLNSFLPVRQLKIKDEHACRFVPSSFEPGHNGPYLTLVMAI